MKEEFEINMKGELNYFIGLQIKQRSDVIFENQVMYTRELIKKFGLEDAKISKTLMATITKLDKDEHGKSVDIKLYHIMIGSLLYLMASRSGILYSICVCARFQSCPKESYLIAVKRIIKFLKGTFGMGLWYQKTRQFSMTSYSDADYVSCRLVRKITSETCQFLGNCFISWSSKK